MNLSPNFTLEEMTSSQYAARNGIDNTPGPAARGNLVRLCTTLLEPIRGLAGRPVHVSSGFRCAAVNRAIGGAPTSAHVDGRAADLEVADLAQLYDAIARADLPFDQLIAEFATWIHAALPADGKSPRRQLLMKRIGHGYETYDPEEAWK